ncbi:hypothetical protein CMI49_01855, partial [Candidatus Pacearchaeota archaeon]|nr:hypothetical protein [Candidatus Pacearchaeota archaeon]
MVGVYRIYPKKRSSFFANFSINTNLILINIFLYIIFKILIYNNLKFWDYIAINPYNIIQGEYIWTFLTSMFMHVNTLHIFANMLSLFFIGTLVEKILGAKRYLYFYLISGLFAGLFFVLSSMFQNDLNTFAVGASGALFGLIGFLMIITPNLPVYIMFIPIPIKMKYAAPGILVVLWFISVTGNIPIGNTAHLGGLIIGIIYGIYLRN